MVVTLQPFLIQFSRFLSEYHKKHIKTTFYLNVTKTKTLLEDTKIELPSKKERNRKLGLIGHGAVNVPPPNEVRWSNAKEPAVAFCNIAMLSMLVNC